jgi:hypothetical protein
MCATVVSLWFQPLCCPNARITCKPSWVEIMSSLSATNAASAPGEQCPERSEF